MKGIYLRYDENGAITSHTIDKDGVKISGDKVDITANREFNVVAKIILITKLVKMTLLIA
ncbi:structural protein [Staphylococcus phage phiPVL-CN125]|uniref:Structural protein n=1 Tax=Staphylococcus phage phiPVL-CN125 TaxID=648017 RepID=C5I679_9CAUD|nr:structural protein [Staphylococcus phage phiPVL-CN125]ACR54243.1 structural protein [Staphylococcus phage phiPVL-CN125]